MTINIILARSINGVIGINGKLPWSLPEDMAHFKQLTSGHTVVMGRKTWDSLPNIVRPLPGRTNIVITRQTDWCSNGAVVAHSIDEAIKTCSGDIWIIGGAEIYEMALPHTDAVYVTEVNVECAGDSFSPKLGDDWRPTKCSGLLTSISGLEYRFVTFCKKSK